LKDVIEKKINFHCTKGFKKIAITRMRIKIEKQNKFSKRTKKFKRIRIKIDIKNKNNVFIER
jgi:hypothetical protein